MRWLCLDYGTRTIGIAVCDAGEVVASAVGGLPRHGGRRDLEAVAAMWRVQQAEAVLIGLPLDLQGNEGPAARRVRAFGAELEQFLACEVAYYDERFSTAQAERVLIEADLSRKRRREVVDGVAATLILQSFLDQRADHRAAGA